jgi:hypothetical protein
MTTTQAAQALGIKPAIETRRVIAEWDGQGWLVMWPDGTVSGHGSKRSVLAAIRTSASADIDVATIEWRQ